MNEARHTLLLGLNLPYVGWRLLGLLTRRSRYWLLRTGRLLWSDRIRLGLFSRLKLHRGISRRRRRRRRRGGKPVMIRRRRHHRHRMIHYLAGLREDRSI